MIIYLAGGVNANLKPLWRGIMDLYIAGCYSGRPFVIEEYYKAMDLYLAGQWPWKEKGIYDEALKTHKLYVLESFFYADELTEKMIPCFGKFLLDSGAFTFLTSKKNGSVNWEEYVEKYADFINRNKVQTFFELDIDPIVGIKEVERLRRKLENLTGKQSIPVWHKSRGKEYYLRMCDEYNYVSLGGIVSKEFKSTEYKYFPWFINEAHKRGAKIHGLGFTNLEGLKKYHFDSVDSTSWTSGNRFGSVYHFDGKTMQKTDRKSNERMANTRELALHNFNEWVKFQKYAETHL